jgi:hypothetical protein
VWVRAYLESTGLHTLPERWQDKQLKDDYIHWVSHIFRRFLTKQQTSLNVISISNTSPSSSACLLQEVILCCQIYIMWPTAVHIRTSHPLQAATQVCQVAVLCRKVLTRHIS